MSGRHGPARRLGAGVSALAVMMLVAGCSTARPAASSATASGSAASGSAAGPAESYGTLPTWLPTATAEVGRVVTSSAREPKLGIQGDTMRAVLPLGTLLVTAVGPAVPEEGQFPIPATTRCTFTVTMSGATTAVPVDAGQWTAIDERNVLHRFVIRPAAQRAVPRELRPGAAVTFDLVGELPPGSGALIWSPVGGATVGTWDFDVEID